MAKAVPRANSAHFKVFLSDTDKLAHCSASSSTSVDRLALEATATISP
jgi:hypothetical protein